MHMHVPRCSSRLRRSISKPRTHFTTTDHGHSHPTNRTGSKRTEKQTHTIRSLHQDIIIPWKDHVKCSCFFEPLWYTRVRSFMLQLEYIIWGLIDRIWIFYGVLACIAHRSWSEPSRVCGCLEYICWMSIHRQGEPYFHHQRSVWSFTGWCLCPLKYCPH